VTKTRGALRSLGVLFLCANLVTGCVWPDYGTGGTDEAYDYSRLSRVTAKSATTETDEYKIAQDIDNFRLEIDLAWKSVAGKYRPAKLTLIETQWGRVAREFAGDMIADAKKDIHKLKEMLLTLKTDLQHITPQKSHDRTDARQE